MLENIAYEKIKELIRTGIYKSGSVISEKMLVQNLEMSRTPVRIAIKQLANEGYVYQEEGHFTTVRILTADDIKDFFQMTLAIEEFAIRYFYEKKIDIDKETMLNIIEMQSQYKENQDLDKYMIEDHKFHMFIGSLLGNNEIINTMESLWDKLQVLVFPSVYNKKTQANNDSINEHSRIYECIALKKPVEETIEAIRVHNFNAMNRLLVR